MANILIVDDHVLNRDFLQTLLNYAGHQTLECGSGEQALALLQTETPDLIIADLLMPNMDGYELIARIKAMPVNADIPIIIYTATYHEHEAKIIARACGAGWILPKPSAPQAILYTVQEALASKRQSDDSKPPQLQHPSAKAPAFADLLKIKSADCLPQPSETLHRTSPVTGLDQAPAMVMSPRIVDSMTSLQSVSLRLTELLELGIELAAERDPSRLVETSARAARRICHANYSSVGILDQDGKRLAYLGTHGLAPASRAALSYTAIHTGVLGQMLALGLTQRRRQQSSAMEAFSFATNHPPVDAFLGVPVMSPTQSFGWLYLVNNDGRDFNEVDERVAITIASQLAVTYESMALVGQLKREMSERQHAQHLLHRSLRARTVHSACNHVMVHAADEATLLRDMCSSVVDAGKYRLASIDYANPDGSLRAMAQAAEDQDGSKPAQDFPGEWTGDGWPSARSALQKATVSVVPDILLDASLRTCHGEAIRLHLRASLSLPLLEDGHPFGVMTIYEREAHAFGEEEILLFQELADDIAYGVIGLRTGLARDKAERALRESEAFSQATIDALGAHLLVLDEAGNILMVNRSLCDFCGRDPTGENYLAAAESTGGPTERDATAFATGIHAVMQNKVSQFTLEYPGSKLLGEHWFLGKVTRFGDDDQMRIVVAHEEITERKNHESHIEYLATHDSLTGLANRTLLSDRLAQAIRQARRNSTRLALMFLDLDRFKNVNDSLGHAIGDLLLKAVADRLAGLVRSEDSLARLGGDEFVILLAGVQDPQNVGQIAAKIVEAFNTPFQIEGHQLYVSTSIGATVFPDDSEDIQSLLRNADTAMYRAKEASGNTFHFYSQEMSVRAIERSELEAALRQAIRDNEFELYYQPKVCLSSGKMIGAEALLRWNHPTLGMVYPNRFIPLAEETGLIVAIGAWVLQQACSENKNWQAAGLPPLCISVNLSVRQFRQPDLVDMIAATLLETRLDAGYLELELTESLVMGNAEQFIERLQALKAMGVQLSIDDFGTGYSSLVYLKRFPIDTLKIDREFIRDIATDPDDAAITRAIISLGHSMNLNVIAEGVETIAQLDYLTQHGCDQMQGYYFSKPLSRQDFTHFQMQGRHLPNCHAHN